MAKRNWRETIELPLGRLQTRTHLESALKALHKDGVVGLFASILVQALLDIRFTNKEARDHLDWINRTRAEAGEKEYQSILHEIKDFWDSDWGRYLRELFGLEEMTFSEFVGK